MHCNKDSGYNSENALNIKAVDMYNSKHAVNTCATVKYAKTLQ